MRVRTLSTPSLLLAAALSLTMACGPSSTPDPRSATTTSTSSASTTSGDPAASTSSAATTTPSATSAMEVPPEIKAVIDAADRSEADRALDNGRHPGELLAFFGVKSGMKVAELFAGGGYTAELLARAVGPTGVVYGQNSKVILERFAAKPWGERLAKPVMKNAVRVDRELDDPLPPEAKGLDLVVMVLVYHDAVWMGADRAKMNGAIWSALKPGGAFVIIDHKARDGAGTKETQTLHRIEEKVVREEVERAGFKLAAEGTFLQNPDDKRDWSTSPKDAGALRGTSDRFALRFVKP